MDEQEDLPKDMLEQVSCRATLRARVTPDSQQGGRTEERNLVVAGRWFPHLWIEEVEPKFHTALSEASRTWFFPCFQNDGWEGRSRLRQMPGTLDAGICLSCCLPSSCYSLAGHRNLLALVENVCLTGMLRISALRSQAALHKLSHCLIPDTICVMVLAPCSHNHRSHCLPPSTVIFIKTLVCVIRWGVNFLGLGLVSVSCIAPFLHCKWQEIQMLGVVSMV